MREKQKCEEEKIEEKGEDGGERGEKSGQIGENSVIKGKISGKKKGENSEIKGGKHKRLSAFGEKSEVKSVMMARQQLLVLLYKDAYFSTQGVCVFIAGL